MSKILDSEIYAARKRYQHVRPDVESFLTDTCGQDFDEHLDRNCYSLEVYYRPDVKTRFWWILRWRENGQQYQVESQYFDLCLWRGIYKRRQLKLTREYEQSAGTGNSWHGRTCEGFQEGDGI